MIRPGFLSPEERRELRARVRSQRERHGIARRANAILLLDDGEKCERIGRFLYLDDDTIRAWHRAWRAGGWEALSADGWKGRRSRMTDSQEAALRAWLDGRDGLSTGPRSTGPVRAWILEEFGLDYSHPGCIQLLRRLGYGPRKPRAPRVSPPGGATGR